MRKFMNTILVGVSLIGLVKSTDVIYADYSNTVENSGKRTTLSSAENNDVKKSKTAAIDVAKKNKKIDLLKNIESSKHVNNSVSGLASLLNALNEGGIQKFAELINGLSSVGIKKLAGALNALNNGSLANLAEILNSSGKVDVLVLLFEKVDPSKVEALFSSTDINVIKAFFKNANINKVKAFFESAVVDTIKVYFGNTSAGEIKVFFEKFDVQQIRNFLKEYRPNKKLQKVRLKTNKIK